jgi:hypothetical protein
MTYIPRYALKDSASLKAKPSAVLIAGIEDGKTVPVCGVKASKMQRPSFSHDDAIFASANCQILLYN